MLYRVAFTQKLPNGSISVMELEDREEPTLVGGNGSTKAEGKLKSHRTGRPARKKTNKREF